MFESHWETFCAQAERPSIASQKVIVLPSNRKVELINIFGSIPELNTSKSRFDFRLTRRDAATLLRLQDLKGKLLTTRVKRTSALTPEQVGLTQVQNIFRG